MFRTFLFRAADGTLSYCLILPKAMNQLLAIASLLVLDVFEESRLPCLVTEFDYFSKIKVAIFAPLAIVLAIVLGCVAWSAACTTKKRRRRGVAAAAMERRRGVEDTHVVKRGLWWAATPALFVIDLLWPSITRILFQFFTCDPRLPKRWLEADYGVSCDSPRYDTYYPWVGAAAFAYAVGVPLLFVYLIRRFKYRGKAGDKVVQAAIGPVAVPRNT